MARYFLEVVYKGTAYSGFQLQENAHTIQAAIEKVMAILFKKEISMTGSSRTDAGVHALQNYFHFDTDSISTAGKEISREALIYKLNAILPGDIVIKALIPVADDAHCRFDAASRVYKYYIYTRKDPFLEDRAYYYPYRLDMEKMKAAAAAIREYTDFTSFSKRNTQVKTFICHIMESEWEAAGDRVIYTVKANRFLRGMVRALVATMLQTGRGKISVSQFREIIEAKDCTKASFAAPPHGLFLVAVNYPDGEFVTGGRN